MSLTPRRRRIAARLTTAFAIIALLGIGTVALTAMAILDRGYYDTVTSGLTDQARFAAVALRPALTATVGATGAPVATSVPVPGALDAQVDALASGLAVRLTVIARDGTVLGDSWEDATKLDNHADRPEVVAALRGEIGVNRRTSATLKRRLFYLALPVTDQNGQVTAIIRVAKVEEEVQTALRQLLWAIGGTTIGAAALTYLLATIVTARVTRPVLAMKQVAERMAAGDLSARVHALTNDEVGELGGSLNALAEQLAGRLVELVQARDEARALLTHMASGVLLIDRDSKLLLANPPAQRWLNIGADAMGRPLAVVRSAALLEAVGRVRAGGRSERVEIRPVPGDDRTLEAILTPISGRNASANVGAGSGNGGIVVVINDISDAKRMARLRSEFVANLSHQFKTPVAVIKGYAETLLDGALAEPETARDFVTTVAREADRLAWLVGQVLELARLEDPNLLLELAEHDLSAIVAAAVERFRGVAAEKSVTLTTALPPSVAPVRCDRKRVEEATGNLIDNALKHSPTGGTVRVTLQSVSAGAGWQVVVSDDGPGIASAALPRIFERFYRGPGAGPVGTGLGLAIVKHVAEVHGGRVFARNRRDASGAEVGYELPRG